MNAAAVQGTLKERPLPRLLQQLYRKQFTGHFAITDQTGDQSDVYVREGSPVHVCRPVDTDRLDNLLVEYGLVPAGILAQASLQVSEGRRLGDVLEGMGALDKEKLAQVLKAQVMRKLTRLFFIAEGDYAVYLGEHGFGKDSDFALMRVDPRVLMYPGIRTAYNLPRTTRELSRLADQRFRLAQVSASFVAALGVSADDPTVAWLRKGWMTLDDLDAVTSRPFEVRSVVLALYYADCLERESLGAPAAEVSEADRRPRSSGVYRVSRLSTESGAVFDLDASESTDALKVAAASTGMAAATARIATSAAAPPPQVEKVVPAAPIAPPPAARMPSPVPFSAAAASPPGGPADYRPSGGAPGPVAFSQPAPAPAAAPRPSASRPVVQVGGQGPPVAPSAGVPVVRAPFVSAVRAGGKPAAAPSKPAPPASTAEATRAAIVEMAAKLEKSTHFEILGVSVNASSDEVGTAFVRAARQFHPDRLAGVGLSDLQPTAEKILARINEAAMVLGSPPRRAEYVASLMSGAQQTAQNLPTLLEAENWFLKGEVFLKKGDHPKAIEAFTAAIKNNPDEPQYHAYQAWARFDDPRARKEAISRETLKILEGVLKDRPKFARGYYWVGQLWKFLNESGRAEQAFREAVRIDESFIEASRELRLIEMRKAKGGKPAAKPESKGRFWKR